MSLTSSMWHFAPANGMRHTPPTGLAFGEPDDRLRRGIQYIGPIWPSSPPRNTGSSAFADDDGFARGPAVIFFIVPDTLRSPARSTKPDRWFLRPAPSPRAGGSLCRRARGQGSCHVGRP